MTERNLDIPVSEEFHISYIKISDSTKKGKITTQYMYIALSK